MKNLRYFRKIVFFVLLLILPFNLRHIFNYDSIRAFEGFREGLTFFLSPFDIGILLILSTFIWEKFKTFKSIFLSNASLYISFIAFILILIISSLFSDNQTIAFYNSIRAIEVIIFFFIASRTLSRHPRTFFQGLYVVFVAGIIQSIIAIFQFALQKSIGIFIFGESHISPNFLGVAKIEHFGEKLVRGYGTFPHPNILGAFLLLSLVCGIILLLRVGEQSLFTRKWKSNILLTIKKRFDFLRWDINSMRSFYLIVGILLIGTGIIITFSRIAWLGALIILIFTFIKLIIVKRHKFPIFNRSFFDKNEKEEDFSISRGQKLLLRDTFFLASLYIIIILVFLSPFIVNRICINNCGYDASSFEIRKEYMNTSVNIVKDNPIWGVGSGNFIITMSEYTNRELHEWEMQPVHSLYLLAISEIGIIGLIIIVYFVVYNIKCNPFRRLLGILFLTYLLLGFFDHFFVSTFQGQVIFWSCLAFFVSSCNIEMKNFKFDNF